MRQLVVEGHDDAVGQDGDHDGGLEDGPVDEPGGEPAQGARRGEQEQGGGTLVQHVVLLLPDHCGGEGAATATATATAAATEVRAAATMAAASGVPVAAAGASERGT